MFRKWLPRCGWCVALSVALMLVPMPPVRGYLMQEYGIDEIAREVEVAAIVRIDKVTLITIKTEAPLKMEASVIDATISVRLPISCVIPKGRDQVRFVAGGRVWANLRTKYRFEVGRHWFICLKRNPFTREFHVMLNAGDQSGPLTAVPIPPDVLDVAVKAIRDLKVTDYDDVRPLYRGHRDGEELMRNELDSPEDEWAGVLDACGDKHIALFFGLLKLHELVLSSKEFFDHFPVRQRLGADDEPDDVEEVLDRGMDFDTLTDSVGGLQLPVIKDEVMKHLAEYRDLWEPDDDSIREEDAWFTERLRRYAALRKKAQLVAVKLLTRLRSAVRRDPRIWVDPHYLGWELGALYKESDFMQRDIQYDKYELAATLTTYIETIKKR